MHAAWNEQLALAGTRVLVTGAGGFLGQHLVRALCDVGAEALPVTRAEADLRSPSALERLFLDLRPELVIHAAAIGGGIGWMKDHPATALSGNVLVNTHVLDAARRFGVRRLVAVSSACAYAKEAAQPMVESAIFAGEPEPTNGPYGQAKRLMMCHGAALGQEFNFDCGFVVPTNLYGPGESLDPVRSHVIGALVRRFEAARREGVENVVCWGTGRATRDLLFVKDAARLIVRALARGGGPEPMNLGSGQERSIAEIAGAVAEACGYTGRIAWDTGKPDGMPRKVLDTVRMRARLGEPELTPLPAGLAEMVAWFRSSS